MKNQISGKYKRLKVWLVLGAQNAGKSTLIRHLSGVARDGVVVLARSKDGDLKIRAIVSSVNERDDPPEPEDWAQGLLDRAIRRGCPNVLLPLRYVSRRNNPPAEQYFRALLAIADLEEILAFGGPRPGWVPRNFFTVQVDKERNERAREVRRHLGWV